MLYVLSSGCSCFKNIVRRHGLMSQTCLKESCASIEFFVTYFIKVVCSLLIFDMIYGIVIGISRLIDQEDIII